MMESPFRLQEDPELNSTTTKIFYPIKLVMLVECGIKMQSSLMHQESMTTIAVSFGKKSLKIWFTYVVLRLKDVHSKIKLSLKLSTKIVLSTLKIMNYLEEILIYPLPLLKEKMQLTLLMELKDLTLKTVFSKENCGCLNL